MLRDGAYEAELPVIRGDIKAKGVEFLQRDYEIAQGFTSHPVKITVPGPIDHHGHHGERALRGAAKAGV